MSGRYLGPYSDMSDQDIVTALDTLAELWEMDVDDWADGDLSERQLEVMTRVQELRADGEQT